MMLRYAGLVVMVAGSVGCGGELTELGGVYRVQAATENLAGCDDDGASVIDQQAPFVFVEAQTFISQEFVAVVDCDDVEACRAEAATDTVSLNYAFDQGSDDDGWTSRLIITSGSDGVCVGTVTDLTLRRSGDDGIRVEARHRDLTFDDPDCETDAAEVAAEDVACTRLDTLTAAFEATL